MWLTKALSLALLVGSGLAQSTQGIYDLLQRRMPLHAHSFKFSLVESVGNATGYDQYAVSSMSHGRILVEGTTLSALSSGLRRYLTDVAHVDIYWYIGSRLEVAPISLPTLKEPLEGASIVPWRYHFNTVTFSYTSAFWSWEDWELQLDWMALHGINLPLAWVGAEKFMVEIFQEIGLTDDEISTFMSGPSFQGWNRFGNIQGSWTGDLPESWIDEQFAMNQQIVARMVALGMTPVLPSFTGFVPSAISRVLPNASVVIGSEWERFPSEYTSDSFLQPTDPNFVTLQKSFVAKQQAAYGNVSHIYTLDQYNENNPSSGDPEYLRNISHSTWLSLKAADPEAIWMMQGWLFYSNSAFWTDSLIEAWFDGVPVDSDMLVLDLFSESQPQWQRTSSYYGKPWIWCQLHNYGGNMGLYGQIMNVTINPIEALASSNSLVGLGLTMEGQEQENQIMYDLLLDQAWSATPIDTEKYFEDWVTTRYSGSRTVPKGIYKAWEAMRTTVYNNNNLTSSGVTKSIFGLEPSRSGLLNRTGHHPTTVNYDKTVLVQAWHSFYDAASHNILLWSNPAFLYDLVDISRQVLANEFITLYTDLVDIYASPSPSTRALASTGHKIINLLDTLDLVLSTNENFQMATWIDRAIARAGDNATNSAMYEYDARNQITLWGPTGQISDYASKDWSGLVSTYYKPRWQIFVDYLQCTSAMSYNATSLHSELLDFELKWQHDGEYMKSRRDSIPDLKTVLAQAKDDWPSLFAKSL